MNLYLSKKADEWVPANRWIVSLSNGETVFEDIRRMNPTWERLQEYCVLNGLSITGLRAQVDGLEAKMPKGQEGYIQKKKMWATGGTSGKCLCIGYTQGGLALIDELGEDRSSRRVYCSDPQEPWTIYRTDIRKKRNEERIKLHATSES